MADSLEHTCKNPQGRNSQPDTRELSKGLRDLAGDSLLSTRIFSYVDQSGRGKRHNHTWRTNKICLNQSLNTETLDIIFYCGESQEDGIS
nr:hypothetical transcript [Hymenolepis microstoma]